jgi:hypothetical protein
MNCEGSGVLKFEERSIFLQAEWSNRGQTVRKWGENIKPITRVSVVLLLAVVVLAGCGPQEV